MVYRAFTFSPLLPSAKFASVPAFLVAFTSSSPIEAMTPTRRKPRQTHLQRLQSSLGSLHFRSDLFCCFLQHSSIIKRLPYLTLDSTRQSTSTAPNLNGIHACHRPSRTPTIRLTNSIQSPNHPLLSRACPNPARPCPWLGRWSP